MSKQKIEESVESRVCFEELEDWVREKIQGWVQELLEEEVTELLGRRKSERRRAVDAPSGYRNGYGKPRHLTLSSGTIQVRRPRVRDLEGTAPLSNRVLADSPPPRCSSSPVPS